MSTQGSPYQDFEDKTKGLGEALETFHQGVQSLQFGMALRNANSQVNQIKSSMLKDEEKTAALNQIATDMVFQMNASGADPARIQQLASSFAPQPKGAIQTPFEGLISGRPDVVKASREYIEGERANKVKEAEASFERSMGKMYAGKDYSEGIAQDKAVVTDLTKQKEAFAKESRDINKASKYAETALKLTDPANRNPDRDRMLMSVLPTMMARASSEVGNLNENERAVFEGAQDWWTKLQQATSTKMRSELIASNLRSIRAIAQVYKDHGIEILNDRAGFYTGQHIEQFGGDADNAVRAISGGKVRKYKQPIDAADVVNASVPGSQPSAGGAPTGLGIRLNTRK